VQFLFKCVQVEYIEQINFSTIRTSYATNKYLEYTSQISNITEVERHGLIQVFLNKLAGIMNTSAETLVQFYILVDEEENLKKLIDVENQLDHLTINEEGDDEDD
jgi:hypothetical protein